MLGIASLVFIQDLLEVGQCLLLEILLLGGEVDPAFDSQGCEASLVLLQDPVDDLTRPLELLGVPEEGCAADQVFIAGVLLPFV